MVTKSKVKAQSEPDELNEVGSTEELVERVVVGRVFTHAQEGKRERTRAVRGDTVHVPLRVAESLKDMLATPDEAAVKLKDKLEVEVED